MGAVNGFASQMFAVEDDVSRKISSTMAALYNRGVDNYFNQYHSEEDKAQGMTYEKLTFNSKSELDAFAGYMSEQGANFLATDFTIGRNNQYVVEIPSVQKDGRTANDIRMSFEQTTEIIAGDFGYQTSDAETPHGQSSFGHGLMSELVTDHLDSLGSAIRGFQQVGDFLGVNSYGQYSNRDIFFSPTDRNGEANPTLRAGQAKTAKVINGDMVIMDGQIVKDPDIINNVMSQYRARCEMADNILGIESHYGNYEASYFDKHSTQNTAVQNFKNNAAENSHLTHTADKSINDKLDEINRLEGKLERGEDLLNFEMSVLTEYKAQVDAVVGELGISLQDGQHLSGKQLREVNDAFFTKAEKLGYNLKSELTGRFDENAWASLKEEDFARLGLSKSSQELIHCANTNVRKLTDQERNAIAIKENLYGCQEFAVTVSPKGIDTVANSTAMFCSWSYGCLDDITQRLNSELIAQNASEKMIIGRKREEIKDVLKGSEFSDILNDDKIKLNLLGNMAESPDEIIKNAIDAQKKSLEIYKEKLRSADNNAAKTHYRNQIETTKKNIKQLDELKSKLGSYSEEELALRTAMQESFAMDKTKGAEYIKEKTGFEISQKEFAALSEQSRLISDLKKSGFLNGTLKTFDYETILGANLEFVKAAAKGGFDIFSANGGISIKKLQALDVKAFNKKMEEMFSKGLITKKFVLTEQQKKLFASINAKGAWGKTNPLAGAKTMMRGAQKGFGFFISKVDGNADAWGDVSQLVSYVSKGFNYGSKIATQIKRLNNTKLNDLIKLYSNKGKAAVKKGVKKALHIKPKTPKPISARKQASLAKKSAKFEKKQLKKKLLTEKKANSFWAKASRKLNAAKKKLAESALGKIVGAVTKAVTGFISTFLLYYFGIAGAVGVCLMVIVLVVALVMSLVDKIQGAFNMANWFAPQTYEDTIAYNLVSSLQATEDIEMRSLVDLKQTAYTNRDYTTFGYFPTNADSGKIQNYAALFDNIEYYNNNGTYDIGVNPFWRDGFVSADCNPEFITRITSFDGLQDFDVTTNLNPLSLINDPSADPSVPAYGMDNGHTSNIKDIVAMTDVMYQMEATDNDDNALNDLLGMSPAQYDIDLFWKKFGAFWTNIWSWIVDHIVNPVGELFGTNGFDVEYIDIEQVPYKTIQNYALNLYRASHQQYIYLDVDYGDINKVITDSNGNEVKLSDDTALELGVCNNKVTNSFKIALNNQMRPEPLLEGSNGAVQFLNEGFFDVDISVEDNLHEKEKTGEKNTVTVDDLCLWENMPTESSTVMTDIGLVHWATTSSNFWNKIETNASSGSKCWGNHLKETRPSVDFKASTSVGDGYSTRSAAIDALKNELKEAITTDINNYKTAHPYIKDFYIINGVDGYAKFYDYTIYSLSNITYNVSASSHTHSQYVNGKRTTYTTYSASGSASFKYLDLTIYSYTHDCNGDEANGKHYFDYCGGHISTVCQENIFSVTNEQLALAGTYEEGRNPTALYLSGNTAYSNAFDDKTKTYKFDTLYPEIHGKIISSEVPYDEMTVVKDASGRVEKNLVPHTAIISGGGLTPDQDAGQGTYVSKGLNLLLADDEERWASGIGYVTTYTTNEKGDKVASANAADAEKVNVSNCRDIFDVDCCILKGNNVFQFKDVTKYEGWTEENMQMVATRISLDWYENYGFDVSSELGQFNYRLSPQDIDVLVEGLKAQYGSSFTEKREEMVRLMLHYVGRGHYSFPNGEFGEDEYETGYGFLSYARQSRTFPEFFSSSTSGTTTDLFNFCYNYLNKKYNGATATIYEKIPASGNGSPSNCLPADFITHTEYDLDAHGNQLDVVLSGSGELNAKVFKDYYLSEQSVMYIGTFNETAIAAMRSYLKKNGKEELAEDGSTEGYFPLGDNTAIRLSNGQVIKTGIPVCVDLNQFDAFSGIALRTSVFVNEDNTHETTYETYSNTPDCSQFAVDYSERQAITVATKDVFNKGYYWINKPDSRTLRYDSNYIY